MQAFTVVYVVLMDDVSIIGYGYDKEETHIGVFEVLFSECLCCTSVDKLII